MAVSRERDGSPGRLSRVRCQKMVVAVGSNFTHPRSYDANDTLSQAVAKSFYQGLFGTDREMKLKNVLAEGYTPSRMMGWSIPLSSEPA